MVRSMSTLSEIDILPGSYSEFQNLVPRIPYSLRLSETWPKNPTRRLPHASAETGWICTNWIATGRVTPCIVSGPCATNPSLLFSVFSLWNVISGNFSASKKFSLLKSLSRDATLVLMLLVSMTTEIEDPGIELGLYIRVPPKVANAPRTVESPMKRTEHSTDEGGQSMSNRWTRKIGRASCRERG